MSKNKIQSLIVEHLLKYGHIEIKLPDSTVLEIGLTQEKNGKIEIKDDYCWIIASQGGRATSIDSYNMGLRFSDEEKVLVLEDHFTDDDGKKIRRLDVV
jgi:hypothetical protein